MAKMFYDFKRYFILHIYILHYEGFVLKII